MLVRWWAISLAAAAALAGCSGYSSTTVQGEATESASDSSRPAEGESDELGPGYSSDSASGGGTASAPTSTDTTASLPPLSLPTVAAGQVCPVSSERKISPDYGPGLGEGPVYPVAIPHGTLGFIYPTVKTQLWYPSDWGGQKVLWVADRKYVGPILIRGGRIDAPGRLGFGDGSRPEWAMRFGPHDNGTSWRSFPSYTRLKAPGCYAYQVDGDGFRTIIVFRAVVF